MNKNSIFPAMGLVLLGGSLVGTICHFTKKLGREKAYLERYKSYYELTNQWLINKNENIEVSDYFNKNNYNSVAIYGMGTLGELLYKDLKKSGIKVSCFIDKNSEDIFNNFDDIPIIGLRDISSHKLEVDVIVVTPIYDFDKISDALADTAINIDIVSLEDIVY